MTSRTADKGGSHPNPVARDPFTGVQIREYDVLIFTGLGLMGRELVNIHSSDIVVVVRTLVLEA